MQIFKLRGESVSETRNESNMIIAVITPRAKPLRSRPLTEVRQERGRRDGAQGVA